VSVIDQITYCALTPLLKAVTARQGWLRCRAMSSETRISRRRVLLSLLPDSESP
jgi:hypothetical protein